MTSLWEHLFFWSIFAFAWALSVLPCNIAWLPKAPPLQGWISGTIYWVFCGVVLEVYLCIDLLSRNVQNTLEATRPFVIGVAPFAALLTRRVVKRD